MVNCTNLKEGDTVICDDCGLELKVARSCECGSDDTACTENKFNCCGQAMKQK